MVSPPGNDELRIHTARRAPRHAGGLAGLAKPPRRAPRAPPTPETLRPAQPAAILLAGEYAVATAAAPAVTSAIQPRRSPRDLMDLVWNVRWPRRALGGRERGGSSQRRAVIAAEQQVAAMPVPAVDVPK